MTVVSSLVAMTLRALAKSPVALRVELAAEFVADDLYRR